MENLELLILKEAAIETDRFKFIKISTYLVQNCNFNDERLLESKTIEIDSLKNNAVLYFDPFLGKVNNSETKVAIAKITDEAFYAIIEENNVKKVEEYELYQDVIVTAKNDEKTFYASHINLWTAKKS